MLYVGLLLDADNSFKLRSEGLWVGEGGGGEVSALSSHGSESPRSGRREV